MNFVCFWKVQLKKLPFNLFSGFFLRNIFEFCGFLIIFYVVYSSGHLCTWIVEKCELKITTNSLLLFNIFTSIVNYNNTTSTLIKIPRKRITCTGIDKVWNNKNLVVANVTLWYLIVLNIIFFLGKEWQLL